jgi:hypothetical protein
VANRNLTTGYAYGFIPQHLCPYVIEEVLNHGTNETYEGFVQETRKRLTDALAKLHEPDGDDFVAAVQWVLQDVIPVRASWQVAHAVADDHFGEQSGSFDISDVVDDVMGHDELTDSYQPDGEIYAYATATHSYQTSYSDGLCLWVKNSPWVTYCRTCSPCVPGAGDLSSCRSQDDSNCVAHCPDPDDFEGWVECLNIVTGEVRHAQATV